MAYSMQKISLFFLIFSYTCCYGYTELELLLQLKSSLVGTWGTGLDDWKQSSSTPTSHYCSFSGISCDVHSRVVSVSITRVPLSGLIPPEIGQFSQLQTLILAETNLTGTLPPQIANLTSLRMFNVSNNNISGHFPSFMTQLQVLDVYNNNLSGPLPKELANLTQLKHLDLGGNYFSGNQNKISHLLALQDLGDLKIFKANLTDEGSFDVGVEGCDIVFFVATPVNFASEDPENDMIKPAVKGVMNVLTACTKAKSVKRIVMTSSASAVSIKNLTGDGHVISEEDWTDVDFLYNTKPPIWGYFVSKTLAEKTAWKFAEENNVDLITVIPSFIAGPSISPGVPSRQSSISYATCLLTGDEYLIDSLKGMQLMSGSFSVVHVEDVCRAHIQLAEKESASGRYICNAVNTNVLDLAMFLSKRYPQYNVPITNIGELPAKAKLILSSEKLVNEGFEFKYGLEEIYDTTVEYLRSKDLLKD